MDGFLIEMSVLLARTCQTYNIVLGKIEEEQNKYKKMTFAYGSTFILYGFEH
jgi:hypothetical protein